ncbi:nuclear transport factor 2 family protein [Lentibacter algarum]|uniref:ester cyclase n=1 Tax=Lentibacter algarum TaxID=576131 RepID=UPI001C073E7A|nr:nuclear transport factor 2 family protein [Lentibacter algarum]MBU2982237.1 nuclear transport factor 2 family protein [Lentibacter algarum]
MSNSNCAKTQLLQHWYDEVWTKGRLEVVDELFSASTRATGIMSDFAVDPNDFKQLVVAIRALCNNPKATIVRSHVEGDWLSAMIQVHTTAVSTAEEINATGMIFARYEGDKIVEAYNNFDFLPFFEQLGQLPEGSLGLLLTGARLS